MSHRRRGDPRPPGIRRGASALAAALAITGSACVLAAPAAAAEPQLPASEPLVVLLHNEVARVRPNAGARRIETVAARRPLTRIRTVLPVLRSSGDDWLQVRLPGRPNGHKGWIRADRTRRTSTGWRILVKLSTRLVTVYQDGRATRRFRAVVGKSSTPTPVGRFFIEEAVALSPQDAGGPFALATSARSNVLQEFEGGPGQIALHGIDNLAGELGSASSHGCIRLSTRAITWLASRIGRGVPLTITR